jgi:hypothetical protein
MLRRCYAPEHGDTPGMTDYLLAGVLLALIVVVLVLLKRADRRRD